MYVAKIVKSAHCPICSAYLERLDKFKYQYVTFDADDESNRKLLNEWQIFDLPAVLIFREDESGSTAVDVMRGRYSGRAIDAKVKAVEKLKP